MGSLRKRTQSNEAHVCGKTESMVDHCNCIADGSVGDWQGTLIGNFSFTSKHILAISNEELNCIYLVCIFLSII